MTAQEINQLDILMRNFIIGQRLGYIKAKCELDKTVLGDLSVALFISPKFEVGDLPVKLFLPPVINGH